MVDQRYRKSDEEGLSRPDWSSPDLKERVYSLSAFTFPACTACNSEFSALEASAKSIVENLLALQPVSAGDFDILLDWFDKVRVGQFSSFG